VASFLPERNGILTFPSEHTLKETKHAITTRSAIENSLAHVSPLSFSTALSNLYPQKAMSADFKLRCLFDLLAVFRAVHFKLNGSVQASSRVSHIAGAKVVKGQSHKTTSIGVTAWPSCLSTLGDH
jgi:hypothetical protein